MLPRWCVLAPLLVLIGCGDSPDGSDAPGKPEAQAGTATADFREWRRHVERRCEPFERYIAKLPDPNAGLEDLRGPRKLRIIGRRLRPVTDRYVAFADDVQDVQLPDEGYDLATDINAALRRRGRHLQAMAGVMAAGDVRGAQRMSELEVRLSAELKALIDKAGIECIPME